MISSAASRGRCWRCRTINEGAPRGYGRHTITITESRFYASLALERRNPCPPAVEGPFGTPAHHVEPSPSIFRGLPPTRAGLSLIPDAIEPPRPQVDISDGVRDRLVTQLQLDLTEIASLVGQRKAATVPELMRMNQRQAALRADAAKHAPEPVNSDSAALSLENIRRAGRLFALDLPQPAHLVLIECLRDAADRSLAALHGQTRRALPGDLRPAQRDRFADPQPTSGRARRGVRELLSSSVDCSEKIPPHTRRRLLGAARPPLHGTRIDATKL